jgi:hypothetical protein
VDEQVRGPYRLWKLTHHFYGREQSTIIEDRVHYRLPFAPLGDLFHPLVRLQLKRIFRFRQSAVRSYLLGAVDWVSLGGRRDARRQVRKRIMREVEARLYNDYAPWNITLPPEHIRESGRDKRVEVE